MISFELRCPTADFPTRLLSLEEPSRMVGILRQLTNMIFKGSGRSSSPSSSRVRSIRLPDDALIYAIGDVHGCLDELRQLERMIVADAAPWKGQKYIILLGDIVDRGPDSSSVIDHVMGPPPTGFNPRICLMGNHESMMLEWLKAPDRRGEWIGMGGDETLRSYGIHLNPAGRRSSLTREVGMLVPQAHIDFLENLPHMATRADSAFVHAGIDPDRDLEDQDVRDLLWIRNAFLGFDGDLSTLIVHGHTPVSSAEITRQRINVDTGCYATGKLSAARLLRGLKPATMTLRSSRRLSGQNSESGEINRLNS